VGEEHAQGFCGRFVGMEGVKLMIRERGSSEWVAVRAV
jgi:hypothetical protein